MGTTPDESICSLSEGLAQVFETARVCRQLLDPGLLPPEPGRSAAEGACLYASVLLAIMLNRYGLARAWVVGGDGALQMGALDVHGVWRGHYWVIAELLSGEIVVIDITADQFGFEQVVMMLLADSKSRYRPGPQDEVDLAVAALAEELGCLDLVGLQARPGSKGPVSAAG